MTGIGDSQRAVAIASRRVRLVLPIALLAVLAVALPAGDRAAAGKTATTSAIKTVRIEGFVYRPTTLTVNRGTTVRFTNASRAKHTATRGGAFDTKVIGPGRSASVRFARKGDFAYHCKLHPFMKGKIVVG